MHLCLNIIHQFANVRQVPVLCKSNCFRRQADSPTEEIRRHQTYRHKISCQMRQHISGVVRRSRDSKHVQACINSFSSFCCWYSHPPDANSLEQSAADEVTVTDARISYLCLSFVYAAEAAAKRKEDKYTEIAYNYHFFAIAFETFDPINQVGTDVISALGHCISSITDNPQFAFSNTFLLRFNGLLLSPIHSAILMWLCHLIRDLFPYSHFLMHLGMKYQTRKKY